VRALGIDLDGAIGDTRPLWEAWLEDVGRRARVELELPENRAAAPSVLDERLGNWRVLLERFAEDHAPVYLRPSPEANAALRRLQSTGVRLGAFTDAPEPLARVAAAHLGVGRRLEALETGEGSLERLLGRLGTGTAVVRSLEELRAAACSSSSSSGAGGG
jgi:phosphoglycolate phosphatase-like HAD superfamily hydrolase